LANSANSKLSTNYHQLPITISNNQLIMPTTNHLYYSSPYTNKKNIISQLVIGNKQFEVVVYLCW